MKLKKNITAKVKSTIVDTTTEVNFEEIIPTYFNTDLDIDMLSTMGDFYA